MILVSLLGWVALVALVIVCLAVAWSRLLAALFPEKIRTAEVDYITTPDGWKLRMCRYRKENTNGEPVLLVHGLNANQNNFSSPADACLVDYLAARGYDCWTIDLRGTRSSQPPFAQRGTATVEGFVWYDLPAAVAHILHATGHERVHYVGHSLGGLLLYAYVQAHGAEKLASGTALGAPTAFSAVAPVIPQILVKMVLRFPWLTGEMLRCAIPLAKLTGQGISAFPINMSNLPFGMGVADFYPILEDPAPLVHAQIFGWAERGVVTLRQDALNLTEGFASMRFPLLAIYAAVDPFVPLDSAREFFDSVRHGDKKMIVCSRENGCGEDYGHCDLAFGREGAREVFEPILHWMKAHPCPETVKAAHAAAAVKPVKAPAPAPAAKVVEAVKAEPEKAAPAAKAEAPEKKEPAKAEKTPAKAVPAKKAPAAKKPAAAKPAPAKPAPAKAAAAPKKKAAAAPAAKAPEAKAPAAKAKAAPRKPAAKKNETKG